MKAVSYFVIMMCGVVLVAACGGGTQQATPPRASASAPPASAPAATVQEQKESSAEKKFAELSKELEKLGKGEPVEQAWLEGELAAILKLDREFAPAKYNQALLRERAGDEAGARAVYEELASRNPPFAPAEENLAAYAAREGKPDEAIAVYKKIIKSQQKNVTSRLALARLLAERKQYQEAIGLARQALQHQADALEAFRVLAESYDAQGNHAMAELIIGRGLKVYKDDVALHYLMAKMMLDKGELTAGVNKLKQIVTIDPKYLKVRAQLAEIALRYRDYGNAAQQFEAILKEDKGNRAASIGLAVSYKGMGRFDQAEKIYQELLQKNANDHAALWNVAVLYHRHLNRYDEAIAAYKKFQASAPSGDKNAAEVKALVADIERQKSDLAAAKAREEKERKKIEAVQAACAAVREGKAPNAEAIGNSQERIEVGWQLMEEGQITMQGGDVPGGEELVKCAFAVTPDTPGGRVEACAPMRVAWTQILYQLGRLEDAMASIKEARKCDPNHPDAQLIEQQLQEMIGASGQTVEAPKEEQAPKPERGAGGKKRRRAR